MEGKYVQDDTSGHVACSGQRKYAAFTEPNENIGGGNRRAYSFSNSFLSVDPEPMGDSKMLRAPRAIKLPGVSAKSP